jgi:hypothetical protein
MQMTLRKLDEGVHHLLDLVISSQSSYRPAAVDGESWLNRKVYKMARIPVLDSNHPARSIIQQTTASRSIQSILST